MKITNYNLSQNIIKVVNGALNFYNGVYISNVATDKGDEVSPVFPLRRRFMAKAVGIDLGTTNSVVSAMEGGEPTVIANAEGDRTTPSIVAFSKSGEILTGEVAKRQAVTNPERTLASVKRHVGTSWTVEIDEKAYTPQEIAARVLQKLNRDAEQYLGD